MAEYIDKDKVLNLDFRINVNLFEDSRRAAERAIQAYADAINKIPAADVLEVVRCKDCQYCRRVDEFEYWCDGFCSTARLVRKDDYCSHGSKRGEDDGL